MERNRARGSWLSQRIDRNRIGVFGHSLGGATAVRVGLIDSRFGASADVDGSLFGQWPLTGLYPLITGNLDPAASIRSQRNAIARFFRTHLNAPGKGKADPQPSAPPAGMRPVAEAGQACLP